MSVLTPATGRGKEFPAVHAVDLDRSVEHPGDRHNQRQERNEENAFGQIGNGAVVGDRCVGFEKEAAEGLAQLEMHRDRPAVSDGDIRDADGAFLQNAFSHDQCDPPCGGSDMESPALPLM
jgi:hypothetical protein